jgi:hypothetical protein
MESLVEAARRLAAGRPDTFDIDRINDAVVYFRRSITRLFLDEEGSLFPRLSTRRPELAEQLAEVAAGHPAQVKLQDQIAELAAALDGESRQGAHKDLLEAATALAQAHHARVARLDHVFTIAKAALTAQDDADIAAEMEKRRDRRDESDQSDDPVPVSRRERSETIAERPVAKRAVAKRAVAAPASTKRVAAAKKKPKPKAGKAAKTVSKPQSKPKPKPKPTSKQVVKKPAPQRRPPKPRAVTPRR